MDAIGTGALAASLTVAGGGIFTLVRHIAPRWRSLSGKIGDAFDALLGTDAVPPNIITGAPAIPRVPSLAEQIAEVRHQVIVNGGKNDPPTLPDQISGIRQQVAELSTELHGHLEVATADHAELARLRNVLDTMAQANVHIWPAIQAVAEADPPHRPDDAA